MREAYFHEDDYRQIELVCDENLEWCVEQAARIEQFADSHRAGAGWTDMYVRRETPIPLAARGITIESFADAVTPLLPPFDAVTTGYSTTVEPLPNVRAFGNDPEIIVFAEAGQEIVSAIWITLQPTDAAEAGGVAVALTSLARFRLLFVDWAWGQVIRLSDTESIEAYLQQRVQTFNELREQFERQRAAQGSWLARFRRWIKSWPPLV